MKNTWKLLPLAVLAVMLFGCGGGGGAADPKSIADDAVKMIRAKDFDSVYNLTDRTYVDESAQGEVREWRITEKYDLWKDYKKRLEGDEGMDPKSKSGIDGEDAWKNCSAGKGWALRRGLYKLYANDDLDKRLDMTWALAGGDVELKEEGHGSAEFSYMNGYGDSISVKCTRQNGLWYLADVDVNMEKELPKKPKDE
jgi:hypothetical protein